MPVTKAEKRNKIKRRIRAKVSGTAQRPRLTVFRSNSEIYVQIVDDAKGVTLAGASSRLKNISGAEGNKSAKSRLVGLAIAERAKALGIQDVVFDRNGFKYHGRIKSLADGAREGGLKF